MKSNQTVSLDQYPNMVIIPVIHIMPMWTDATIPFILINQSTKSIFLSKHDILGFLYQIVAEIC